MNQSSRKRYVERAYRAMVQAEEARLNRFHYLEDPCAMVAHGHTIRGSRLA